MSDDRPRMIHTVPIPWDHGTKQGRTGAHLPYGRTAIWMQQQGGARGARGKENAMCTELYQKQNLFLFFPLPLFVYSNSQNDPFCEQGERREGRIRSFLIPPLTSPELSNVRSPSCKSTRTKGSSARFKRGNMSELVRKFWTLLG